MSNRSIERLGLLGLVAAALVTVTSCLIGAAGRVDVESELESARSSVEAVARLRTQGEEREFDARIGALRIVAASENRRLERALVGIEAVRRIERESGRGGASDAAIALGLEDARGAVANENGIRPDSLAALLSAIASVFVLLGTLAVWQAMRSNERGRRRIVDGMGLEPAVSQRETFADEVLLEWVRRGVSVSPSGPRIEVASERGGLTLVEPRDKAESAPPTDLGSAAGGFGPTRRR